LVVRLQEELYRKHKEKFVDGGEGNGYETDPGDGDEEGEEILNVGDA
jgi:hypothetical protein